MSKRGTNRMSFAGSGCAPHLLAIVLGSLLLALPVHARAVGTIHLEPIGPRISLAGLRIFGDDRRQGDEASAVQRPALQDGKIEQRKVVALDDFLAGAGGNFLGKELAHLGQHGQHLDFVENALRRLDVHEVLDTFSDFVERIHVERHAHAAL